MVFVNCYCRLFYALEVKMPKMTPRETIKEEGE